MLCASAPFVVLSKIYGNFDKKKKIYGNLI